VADPPCRGTSRNHGKKAGSSKPWPTAA